MSNLSVFAFESYQVRTLGTAENPLFVAMDIASALGYRNPKTAVSLAESDDISKMEITTAGGRQTVNCVNESGLYALIFGSKLESAKRFKRWVTSEVLPAIRRQGRYECPLAGDTITNAQQVAIQQAVSHRAKRTPANYQTIYRAIKIRYQIPRYTELKKEQFEDCLRFIKTVDLTVPETKALPNRKTDTVEVPRYMLENIRIFTYNWRYLFRKELQLFDRLLHAMNSPYAPRFYDAVTDMHLCIMEKELERLGFPVKDLPCYEAYRQVGH